MQFVTMQFGANSSNWPEITVAIFAHAAQPPMRTDAALPR